MTREEAIEILEFEKQGVFKSLATKNAIDMAIASLKTDEVYQLEYENRDFVEIHKGMTNGEVIQALFPNPHIDAKSHTVWVGYDAMAFTREWWNAPYKAESED